MRVLAQPRERRGAGRTWDDDLERVAELVHSAAVRSVGLRVQPLERPRAAYYIGKGKAQEASKALVWELERGHRRVRRRIDAGASPQPGEACRRAGHRPHPAHPGHFRPTCPSKEGKLQVELAQLTYLLPRLAGAGVELSRLGGGIGTGARAKRSWSRTGGASARIADIRRELERSAAHPGGAAAGRAARRAAAHRPGRVHQRRQVHADERLTDAGVLREDLLFATLDPTIRKVTLADGREALLADTVGFIRKLPHQLVAAFRATLEEVEDADVLLHVVDASRPDADQQMAAVEAVLDELGVLDKPMVTALNKLDLAASPRAVRSGPQAMPYGVAVSAQTGDGLDELRKT